MDEIYDDGGAEEEIYDDGEAEEIKQKPKPAPAKPAPSNKPSVGVKPPVIGAKPGLNNGGVGMTVKERMALLNVKPTIPMNKPTNFKKKEPVNGVSNITKSIGNQLNNNQPAISLAVLKERKKSLKGQNTPFKEEGSAPSEEPAAPEKIYTDGKENKSYKKAKFVKRPIIKKPASMEAVTLPIIQYKDESGVELRIGAGREESNSSLIKSMGEEEEEDSAPPPPPTRGGGRLPGQPQLPSRVPPTIPSSNSNSLSQKRTLAPPPQPAAPEPSVEELYDEGEAASQLIEEEQDIYEEFDGEEADGGAPSLPSSPIPVPDTKAKEPSPEAAKKQTKADKEREKKEKKEQERIEKLRQKETKQQQEIIKRYKITDDELVTSHHVKVVKDQGSGKHMLPAKSGQMLALVRKIDTSKWIVKDTATQNVGLVDAAGMYDPEEVDDSIEEEPAPNDYPDEEVYEELN